MFPVLFLLSGCEWFKQRPVIEKEETKNTTDNTSATSAAGSSQEVLLTIKGNPAITVQQFEKYLDMIFKAEPQYKQLLAMMPDAESEFFGGLVREALAQNWVTNQKIDQRADYQNDRKLGIELFDRQLAMKYFQEEYPKTVNLVVTDAEAKKIYDEKKDTTPELIISRGGVNAVGIAFDTQADADAFLAKAKEKGAQFEKLARDKNLTPTEFKNVSGQSFDVQGPIREKLLSKKTFPSFDVIKVKDKVWVVKATGKGETTYVSFEQVKEPIKQQLKMQKLFTEELEKVKKELSAVENKEYFERKKAARQQEMEKAQAQMKAQQEMPANSEKEDLKPAITNASTVKGA